MILRPTETFLTCKTIFLMYKHHICDSWHNSTGSKRYLSLSVDHRTYVPTRQGPMSAHRKGAGLGLSIYFGTGLTTLKSSMSLILQWGEGTTNNKNNNKKRTAIHHNAVHPRFIIQAQVSVIQHSGDLRVPVRPGSNWIGKYPSLDLPSTTTITNTLTQTGKGIEVIQTCYGDI